VQIADPHYYTGGNTSVKPITLAAQEFRGTSPSGTGTTAQPATAARAAKKAAASQPANGSARAALAAEDVFPAGAPLAPSPASRAWLIIIAGLTIAIVGRRVLAAVRR
jgi:hypothetical protein